MSNAASALGGVSNVEGWARIEEIGPVGMITLRGDLSSAAVKKAIKTTGCAMPQTRKITRAKGNSVAWMSPDELLVLCAYEDVHSTMAALHNALGAAHALVANVSDARAVFRVSGAGAREVVAKLAPLDMAPDAVAPGDFRRTRFAQVPAAFHMLDADTCEIVCFRSVAQYMFDVLVSVSRPGSEVGFFS